MSALELAEARARVHAELLGCALAEARARVHAEVLG